LANQAALRVGADDRASPSPHAFCAPLLLAPRPSDRKEQRNEQEIATEGIPKKEHAAPEWQAAMEARILVAEGGGPTMFARIGVMRALNRHYVPEINPKGKEPHWGRRKLKRDR
jgi:hypothetical protein